MTGCSNKLYTYEKIVSESKNIIANDIVIDNPGSFNRNNGLKAYTAYLERDKNKKDNYNKWKRIFITCWSKLFMY